MQHDDSAQHIETFEVPCSPYHFSSSYARKLVLLQPWVQVLRLDGHLKGRGWGRGQGLVRAQLQTERSPDVEV